jgi:hypothetical protein
MKKRGKIIYVGYPEYIGLESIGKEYISKTFLDGKKRVSYNKSIKFLLSLVQATKKIKNAPIFDKDEEDD